MFMNNLYQISGNLKKNLRRFLMKKKPAYQLNDRTLKYQTLAQTKRLHQYLGLPGEFKTRLPQEIVFPNMDFGRVDEYYMTNEGLLVNFEEESGNITEKTKEKFSKYVIFASYRYMGKLYLAVLCHQNPNKHCECYEYSPSVHIKIYYYYFSQNELWKKYENIINKIKQKEELTDTEALDIAFISKFISKEHAPSVIESLAEVFKKAIIEDKLLKMDVGVILGGMILKHITSNTKQNKLLELIGMRHIENEIDKLVYDEYGDILDEKDKEIEKMDNELKTKDKKIDELNQTNEEYKNKLKELNKTTNLPPEAKKIINSMLLL